MKSAFVGAYWGSVTDSSVPAGKCLRRIETDERTVGYFFLFAENTVG